MFFFIWFFQTTEGQTFLSRRSVRGGMALSVSNDHHQLYSGLSLFALMIVLMAITGRAERRAGKAKVTAPFHDRGFWSLWQGGGTFEGNEGSATEGVTFYLFFAVVSAHLFYWYWSDASLALMQCCLMAAMMADGLRVACVYVLHKRYFG
jgi:hypothetical protein